MLFWHCWVLTPIWYWGIFCQNILRDRVIFSSVCCKGKYGFCFWIMKSQSLALIHTILFPTLHLPPCSFTRFVSLLLTPVFHSLHLPTLCSRLHSLRLCSRLFHGCFSSVLNQKLLKVRQWEFHGKGIVFHRLNVHLIWFSYGV